MHRDKSLKAIGNMSPDERWELAQKKLSSSNTKNGKNEGIVNEGIVPALLNHMRVHENTRWLVYSSHLTDQITESHAAHAFTSLQVSALHYEIIRLCTFWDPIDLDSRSIPTIIALVDCPEVSKCVYDDHYTQYEHYDMAHAKACGKKARRRLRDGIRGAGEIEKSEILQSTRNFRDKLAHQLEVTKKEKDCAVPLPRYGDERKLLEKTVTTVNRLYLSLNGTDFAWDNAKKMHKRNAEAFWKGVTIEVLR